jgi:hypothetical protein
VRSPTTNVLYILECLHVMPGTRASEGTLLCYNCAESRAIIGVHVYEWHAKCERCTWARWTGLSKEIANHFASKHARLKDHVCKVVYEPSPEGVDAEKRLIKAKAVVK